MLRTCNALRIAGLPVLRNDGRGKALPSHTAHCAGTVDGGRGLGRGYWAWIASRGSQRRCAVRRTTRTARTEKGGFETRPYEIAL
ncbi:MAG: hypothetical protein LBM98_04425 [Oscillospiraceae bacterium]|nr:hypothetical protein [Oscillospiraceae bacterium]